MKPFCLLTLAVAVFLSVDAQAQNLNTDALPADSGYGRTGGQNVQPFYEGWQKLPNGRTVMWFGYLNRNYAEQLDVPVGADNKFDLQTDMSQPAHFYPRRHLFVFKVELPENWTVDKKLVWTVTAHGKTSAATGWLQPEWEVDEGVIQMNLGPGSAPPDPPNHAPTIAVRGDTTVASGKMLRLAVTALDDGVPKARRRSSIARPAQTSEPAILPPGAAPPPRAQVGLRIKWILYRAPDTGGTVNFGQAGTKAEPGGTSAELATDATFSAPGNYWLRAIATDGLLETPSDLKVNVIK